MNTKPEPTAGDTFDAAYNLIDTVIPFDPNWNNGTGYFDAATKVALVDGAFAKSHCEKSNRKLIFHGTRLGTFVVFQRYTNGGSNAIVYNGPHPRIASLGLSCLPAGRIGHYQLCDLFGIYPDGGALHPFNLSYHITDMLDVLAQMQSSVAV